MERNRQSCEQCRKRETSEVTGWTKTFGNLIFSVHSTRFGGALIAHIYFVAFFPARSCSDASSKLYAFALANENYSKIQLKAYQRCKYVPDANPWRAYVIFATFLLKPSLTYLPSASIVCPIYASRSSFAYFLLIAHQATATKYIPSWKHWEDPCHRCHTVSAEQI